MYFWKYILAKKAGLSQKKCNMALYGLPVLPIAEAFEKTVTGNPITITDALAQDALSLQVAFQPTQDGTPSIDSEPETEPYLSKLIPRGNKEYYSLVGGTVAWNQIAPTAKASWNNANATITGDSDEWTLTSYTDAIAIKSMNIGFPTNHVAFCSAYLKTNTEDSNIYALVGLHKAQGVMAGDSRTNSNSYTLCQTIVKMSSDAVQNQFVIRMSNIAPQGTTINAKKVICADLTLMFANNPAIADYAYSLEQSEAGSGIAWLKSYGFFTEDYYPYNPGELISVNTSGHKIGGTTYPIDPTDLRGLFKLSNGKLYCEGDIYPPSGDMSRKYGIVDLGSLDWGKTEHWGTGDVTVFGTSLPFTNAKGASGGNFKANIICTKFLAASWTELNSGTVTDGINITNTKFIQIVPSATYTDAAAFKTAMSGVYLVYELETPTTESATPYTSPIDVEAGGTEEFVDNRTVPIPVGNETYYASEYEVKGKASVTVSHGVTEDDPNPTEYEVEFTQQGTVYGGTVDIVTGVLTVTWAVLSNPQNLNWITNSSQGMKNFQTDRGTVSKKSGSDNWKCSRYSNGFIGTDKSEGIFIFDSGEVCIRDYRYWEHGGTSAETAAFKASLADVTIAYELATPQTYNLTPEQVTMLLGNNYLETEDGTITITYMAGR